MVYAVLEQNRRVIGALKGRIKMVDLEDTLYTAEEYRVACLYYKKAYAIVNIRIRKG